MSWAYGMAGCSSSGNGIKQQHSFPWSSMWDVIDLLKTILARSNKKALLSQGSVIRKVSDPILGRPPDLSRPPTPQIFSSKKPLVAAHTPDPPRRRTKFGVKLCPAIFKTRGLPPIPLHAQSSTPNNHGRMHLNYGLLYHNNINIAVLLSIKTCGYIITYVASMFACREISVGCYFSTIYTHT